MTEGNISLALGDDGRVYASVDDLAAEIGRQNDPKDFLSYSVIEMVRESILELKEDI